MGRFRNEQGEEAGLVAHSGQSNVAAERSRISHLLRCPHCGQMGGITWEEDSIEDLPTGVRRRIIDLSPGFHAEKGRTHSGDSLIVCTICDMIQSDWDLHATGLKTGSTSGPRD